MDKHPIIKIGCDCENCNSDFGMNLEEFINECFKDIEYKYKKNKKPVNEKKTKDIIEKYVLKDKKK